MITHDEARNAMMKIESYDAYYGEFQEEHKLMSTYIAQQEKKDELSELYRKKANTLLNYPVFKYPLRFTYDDRISQLEKEIEELK